MDETNVQVAVRVRPVLQREQVSGEQPCIRVLSNTNQILIGKDRSFTYDNVFNAKAAQAEVYEQCFRPLISACFEGYNCTVFAYGQTGSGKTYTIGGNIGLLTEEEYGILPRAIDDMFKQIQESDKIEYKVRVSYFEIYKEELCDLLDTDTANKELSIREDEMGNTVVIGAEEVECESLDDVMTCLRSGSALRHTGSTQMNEHSSRSHSIFTILIEQKWVENEPGAGPSEEQEGGDPDSMHCYKYSKFHFVDLAGSERAQKTGNVGDRFKESIHINTGLLAVGNVISALGDPRKKVSHIPYRDAKITRILKDSLGGNAKTLMICCVNPCLSNMDESLNSLKYANRARNIKNTPVINRDRQTLMFEEMQSEIMHLREELARQRTSLYSGESTESRTVRSAERRQLEEQLNRMRTECTHYRMLADEAYKQLVEIQTRKMLTKSLNIRLQDWLDLVDEIKNRVSTPAPKTPQTPHESESLQQIQRQLKKAYDDLKNDEQIFVDKNKEVLALQDKVAQLERANHELAETHDALQKRNEKQADQLVQMQMRIEDSSRKHSVKIFSTGSSQDEDEDEAFVTDEQPTSARRVKSVPASALRRRRSSDLKPPAARNIHTSPGLLSLDRVMQGFRARSQLLVHQLEEDDHIRLLAFNKDSVTDEEGDESSNFIRHGTYKLKRPFKNGGLPEVETVDGRLNRSAKTEYSSSVMDEMQIEQLHQGADLQRRKIKESQLKLQNANQKMRDLAINIRLKEQLIRDLVKSGKEADNVNRQYAEKIKHLEKEKTQAKTEVAELQKALNDLAEKGHQETSQKKQIEVQRKLEAAKNRMQAVQRKQKEVEKVANISGHNKNKIQELEGAIDKMRHQQDQLQRKLKEESERKEKLEREMTKEHQKISDLEIRNAQQQKILKRKTEEIAAVQRRLRSGSSSHNEEQHKMEEQKKWLDGEIDRVVQLRQNMEALQEDLKKREEIVQKKEDILTEKSRLEMKKLRSSQNLNKDMLSVVNKLADVERELTRRSQDFHNSPEDRRDTYRAELKSLQENRQTLIDKRNFYDEKLHLGTVLSDEEERRLIELDEAVEALDVAIEYKTESIQNHEQHIRKSQSQVTVRGENDLGLKLGSMSNNDCRTLLTKYFERVVELRESERKKALKCSELEVRGEEQDRLIKELESSLDHCTSNLDRRLTHQQQVYEQKIQTLLHQLANTGGANDPDVTERIQELEKDLYYYKKTSRDLKRKIKELTGESQPPTPSGRTDDRGDMEIVGRSMESRPASAREDLPSSRPTSVRSTNHNGSTPRSARTKAANDVTSARGDVTSARGDVTSARGDVSGARTPVKVSKKDLRHMSQEEVQLRKSNFRDSLEPSSSNNHWD